MSNYTKNDYYTMMKEKSFGMGYGVVNHLFVFHLWSSFDEYSCRLLSEHRRLLRPSSMKTFFFVNVVCM